MRNTVILLLLLAGLNFLADFGQAANITVLPAKVALHGKESSQRIVVQKSDNGTIGAQIRAGVEFTSSNLEVATVERAESFCRRPTAPRRSPRRQEIRTRPSKFW